MSEPMTLNLETVLLQLLQRKSRDYLTVREIVASLPRALRRQIGVQSQRPVVENLPKLTAHMGPKLHVYTNARTTYIGYALPDEELILRQMKQVTSVSSKRLGARIPLLKKAYLTALNALLARGLLVCTLKEDHGVSLALAPPAASETTRDTPETVAPLSDRRAFHQAYLAVGKGRNFVDIHHLRTALAWPPERFERVLRDLRADYTIELHGGDPSTLSDVERQQSFTDIHGMVYLTLSWRGTTP